MENDSNKNKKPWIGITLSLFAAYIFSNFWDLTWGLVGVAVFVGIAIYLFVKEN